MAEHYILPPGLTAVHDTVAKITVASGYKMNDEEENT